MQEVVQSALDIEAAGELRRVLLDSFSRGARVSLDLSSVERCDAAGLQVLLAAKKTADASGQEFSYRRAPAVVIDAAAALGISLEGMTTD